MLTEQTSGSDGTGSDLYLTLLLSPWNQSDGLLDAAGQAELEEAGRNGKSETAPVAVQLQSSTEKQDGDDFVDFDAECEHGDGSWGVELERVAAIGGGDGKGDAHGRG